jgi:lipid II:glycine glycyltransferase (peptidoglycan interpeptide bridge formation enzyme)
VEELVRKRSEAPPGTPVFVDASGWPAADWDALAARSPLGDAFQSYEWGEVKRSLGWTPLRYAVELDGRRVAVVFIQERPLMRRLRGPLRRLCVHYAPRGPILLEATAEAATAALSALEAVARVRHSVTLTIDPTWREDGELAATLPGSGFRPAAREVQVSRTAMVIPLRADELAQHALLDDSTATNINKARRAGVSTERIDLTTPAVREAALAEFYEMHAATGRREDFLVRDREYEMSQWRGLGEAGLASLWFASVEGRRRSGLLLLHCGRYVVLFAAGSPDDADLRKNRANHLLHWSILRWAAAAGFEGYDLGGVDTHEFPGLPEDSSHPLWNLYEFKRRLGAVGEVRIRAHEYAPSALVGTLWRFAWHFR